MTFEGGRDTERIYTDASEDIRPSLVKILSARTVKYAGARLKKKHIWAEASIIVKDARKYSCLHK